MGRKSKLTPEQWEEVGARLLGGETAAKLAEEYGVSKTTISLRFSKLNQTVRETAELVVQAETAVMRLPPKQQAAVRSLSDQLLAISAHVASAAEYGAATAHRLAGIAHAKVQEVDDSKPLDDESREALKDVAVLTKMSNEAGSMALNLLHANKGSVPIDPPKPQGPLAVDVLDAAAEYQRLMG